MTGKNKPIRKVQKCAHCKRRKAVHWLSGEVKRYGERAHILKKPLEISLGICDKCYRDLCHKQPISIGVRVGGTATVKEKDGKRIVEGVEDVCRTVTFLDKPPVGVIPESERPKDRKIAPLSIVKEPGKKKQGIR